MVDKPDLEKLKNKFDINGIMDTVKSIINPVMGTPEVDPDDDLGVKIAQASILLKEMAAAQAEQAKNLSKVNEMLNMIFQDIESLRKEVGAERRQKVAAEPAPKHEAAPEKPVDQAAKEE